MVGTPVAVEEVLYHLSKQNIVVVAGVTLATILFSPEEKMEIGPFECTSIIIDDQCKELTEALLDNRLSCASCGNKKFKVKALVEAEFVVSGGEVPIVCPSGENKIHVIEVVKCSKETCGCMTFVTKNKSEK